MRFIVFDLELNQHVPSMQNVNPGAKRPQEIIQIGAVKLDRDLSQVGEFRRCVKPSIYAEMDPFIAELTGISMDILAGEAGFPEVLSDFLLFCEGNDCILCTWGVVDISELYRNAKYHAFDLSKLPRKYIDLQAHAARRFGLPKSHRPSLESVVEALRIPQQHTYHDALNDAIYTSEIFRQISHTEIKPLVYDPNYVRKRLRQPKREVDYDALLRQFQKMLGRKLTEEEQQMVVLAYKMGRTNQFIKDPASSKEDAPECRTNT